MFFFRIVDDTIHLYKGYMQDFTRKRKKTDTKRTIPLHHYIEREKLRKYLSGILSIENDEADLGRKTNQSINDKTTLITNISLSATYNLYRIYQKSYVSYYP